jgi:CBS domain-containing protein
MASQSPNLGPLLVATDLMRPKIRPLQPDDSLDVVVERFVENNLDVLPVIDEQRKVLGLVRRSEVSSTYLRHVHGTTPVIKTEGGASPQ